MFIEMENHLLRIVELADTIFLVSCGLADISPEGEESLRIISDILKNEASEWNSLPMEKIEFMDYTFII